jgi:methylated-DNA-[protein]-cysteine S-methyltransferase
MKTWQQKISSPLGVLYLTASAKGLRGIYFKKQSVSFGTSSVLARAARELREYFGGKRKRFTVPLDVREGTAFQKKVWRTLSKIPYGETLSYKDVAARIRHARAVRAVGTANGKNPICIIVPCHRVIAANGGIGGYSAGLRVKKRLLALEKS